MADPLTAGLHTTGILIDKGFDHIPASAFSSDPYKKLSPKRLLGRSSKKSRSGDKRPPSDNESEDEVDSEEDNSGNYVSQRRYSSGSRHNYPPQYSREPPHLRPEYMPRPLPGQNYFPPPPPVPEQGYEATRARDDQDAYYNSSAPRRPHGVIRRTSSFHGHDRNKSNTRSKGSSDEESHKSHSLRDDFFTSSTKGLAGGLLGAIVGGWAAEKAQIIGGREERGSGNIFLTGLGAVAGGLAANAAVDHYEHKKKANDREDAKWEEKWGKPESSKERRRRRMSGSRHEREGDSDSDDHHGDPISRTESKRVYHHESSMMSGGLGPRSHDYRGERNGLGYAPYADSNSHYN